MPETWVHGNCFVPRLYGPDHLAHMAGIPWTDIQGLKDGQFARFNMKDERMNHFHAPIPVVGTQRLLEARVEYFSAHALLFQFWVHQGSDLVKYTEQPFFETQGSRTVTVLDKIDVDVSRGLCISLGFSTMGRTLGGGEISFFAAGAVFA